MFQITQLQEYNKLFHCFSTTDDGNMANSISGKLTDFNEVLKNRKRFLSKVGIPIESTVGIWVEGKDTIKIADNHTSGISMINRDYAVKCDGLVTNKKGLYLFLLIADCLPIIIYDPKKQVVGLIHAGWKGVDLNIARTSMNRFIDSYKCNPKDIIVFFGPAARKGSFIKENPSQLNDLKWKPFIEKVVKTNKGEKGKLYKIDFVGLCRKQFIDAGIKQENLFDSKIDTITDQRFFSHYRDKDKEFDKQGRFACVVGLD